MDKVILKQCDRSMVNDVEHLEKAIFRPHEVYTRGFLEWLCDNCSRYSYVALKDDRYVGYIITCIDRPGQGHIVSIGVLSEYRGMGIGTSLMCASICSLRGIVSSYILEVRVSNSIAIRLYEKLGFRIRSRLLGYYSDGEDAYLMALDGERLGQAYSICQCSS